jgi:cephalosporin hydroxylase
LIKNWADIPGFFDFMDIYDQAVAEAKDGDRLVEVGTFLGKSAAYMALKIQESGKNLKFLAVDSWDPVEYAGWWNSVANDPPRPWPVGEVWGIPLWEAFNLCIHAVGAEKQITPVRMRSLDAAKSYDYNSLAFVFIDANHIYEHVKADILAWAPKVQTGGFIAGHDYDVALWPGVKKAVDEIFPKVEHRGTSWLVRM